MKSLNRFYYYHKKLYFTYKFKYYTWKGKDNTKYHGYDEWTIGLGIYDQFKLWYSEKSYYDFHTFDCIVILGIVFFKSYSHTYEKSKR